LLLDKEQPKEFVILKAIDNAIPTAITVADVLSRRIPNLHQVITIEQIEIEDIYNPLEEGLDQVRHKRRLSLLQIKLTTKPNKADNDSVGFKAARPKEDCEYKTLEEILNPKNFEGGAREEREPRKDGESRPYNERRGGGDRRGPRNNEEPRPVRDGETSQKVSEGGNRYRRNDGVSGSGNNNGGFNNERRDDRPRRYNNDGGRRENYKSRGNYQGERRQEGGEKRYDGERRNYNNGGERRNDKNGGERRNDNGGERRQQTRGAPRTNNPTN